MHVVVTVGITSGIFIGAPLQSTGYWIIPFGIVCIVTQGLTYDKYSFAYLLFQCIINKIKLSREILEKIIKIKNEKLNI